MKQRKKKKKIRKTKNNKVDDAERTSRLPPFAPPSPTCKSPGTRSADLCRVRRLCAAIRIAIARTYRCSVTSRNHGLFLCAARGNRITQPRGVSLRRSDVIIDNLLNSMSILRLRSVSSQGKGTKFAAFCGPPVAFSAGFKREL